MLDLYYALTNVDIQRVHITLTIDDFDCIVEDRRYIFYNRGNNEVSILPLPARKRETQRNMKIEDFSNRNLVFIPSSSSASILVETCTKILDKSAMYLKESEENLNKSQIQVFEKITKEIKPNLNKVFEYKPDAKEITSVYKQVGKILQMEIPTPKKFTAEIFNLVEIIKQYNNGLFNPLITLPEPFTPDSYLLLKLSVERLKEFLADKKERFRTLFRFGVLGKFTFSFLPELHPAISNHVRVYAPDGLLIRDVEFDLTSQSEPERDEPQLKDVEKTLNQKKERNFDEKCFYIQLGPEESTLLYTCKALFNVTFGLSKKGFHLGILPLLSFFLWLTVLSPVFFTFLRDPQFILMLLTLSVTILVAIGIYAIDKKIVNHYIITQVVLAFSVFVAELCVFVFN